MNTTAKSWTYFTTAWDSYKNGTGLQDAARKVTNDFDKFHAASTKELLEKEVIKDITEAEHKTINIVSDHRTARIDSEPRKIEKLSAESIKN